MEDSLVDCSTDDEPSPRLEQQDGTADQEDADEGEEEHVAAVNREPDATVKEDFGTETNSESSWRAAPTTDKHDVEPHMDAGNRMDADDIPKVHLETNVADDADSWQHVSNRKDRKKSTPVTHAVARSGPKVSVKQQQNVREKQRIKERWIHCRFEVGIEDSSEFPVCRRLIGAGGANMEFIVEESGAARVHVDSKEPVMVCVSAPSRASLDSASALISDLLTDVHEEYRKFCSLRGRSVPKPKVIALREGFP